MRVIGNPTMGTKAPKAIWLLMLAVYLIWFVIWLLPEALHG